MHLILRRDPWNEVALIVGFFIAVSLFYFIFNILGRNNTHPVKNNDEISLSLKKHKGREVTHIVKPREIMVLIYSLAKPSTDNYNIIVIINYCFPHNLYCIVQSWTF